ncbi:MAG TPA: response regulator [Thermoanaerobaculia bacterium]|nr:response regulator [Thermoanaerobaculia bacterium]
MTAPRILIADDDAAIRTLMRAVAARRGFIIDEAGDGSQCLGLLRRNTYDLLLLDLSMPFVNGFDVIARLRSERRRPAVVVVSALSRSALYDLDPDVVTCVLRKPFDVDVLASIIAKLATAVHGTRVVQGRRATDRAQTAEAASIQ